MEVWASKAPEIAFKIPKDPPLLVLECIRVHSTMERSAGASFGGGMASLGGGSGWQFLKTWGFLTRGFSEKN